MNLVREYIKDLKVEGVKLQFQLCSPRDRIQKNDVLGNFDFDELHSDIANKTIRAAITQIEQVSTYEELFDLFDEWDKTRVEIQYQGYFNCPKRKTEAWCYVFFKRILKRNHQDLYEQLIGK